MKLIFFLRFCFLCPILFSNIYFLSRRVVFECIENVEIRTSNSNSFQNFAFLQEFYWMNYIILYNFDKLIFKLKTEFQYYLFTNIFKHIGMGFYELFFYKKECNETFIKYLYFVFWTLIEFLFVFSPNVNLFSFPHYRYRFVFFTILTSFYFASTY